MNYELHLGDNREVLRSMPSDSADSIVCDPPYELGFMGKRWDSTGIAYDVTLWMECLRVLKPGGHLLAFGGSRTYHRLAVAIEDAGFEIRDCIMWLYGSGFPKSHDVSKALDKQAGAERTEVIGTRHRNVKPYDDDNGWNTNNTTGEHYYTAPATPLAQQWQGWGTALKPAHEPIVVARKPLQGTVADNVQAWGVGALNIDGCRVEYDGEPPKGSGSDNNLIYGHRAGNGGNTTSTLGRWPANIILDEEAAQMLDEQSGWSKSGAGNRGLRHSGRHGGIADGENLKEGTASIRGHSDSGGASRFFYVAKASKAEREAGLEGIEQKLKKIYSDMGQGSTPQQTPSVASPRANHHPTVKPIALMRYLVRMVTPRDGVVLDPFMGSGTTAMVAVQHGRDYLGCELNPAYEGLQAERLSNVQECLF